MYQCAKELKNFHEDEVKLSSDDQTEMRKRRDSNRSKLKSGLKNNDDPMPIGQWSQGSYAMHTMIQDQNCDYDIDDGAYFHKHKLVGPNGGDKTPQAAKQMVCDALDRKQFKTPPEVKTNCVRIHYEAGYHVDVPVYRQWTDDSGEAHIELASTEWKKSDPRAVTKWFNKADTTKSPSNDKGQMRRIVRMLKNFAKSRSSWRNRMPSGFVISVLVEEKFEGFTGDDEKSLHKTMKAIKERLDSDLSVVNPVDQSTNLAESGDAKARYFRTKLEEKLDYLEKLEDAECSKSDALRAWKKTFKSNYFENLAAEEDDKQAKKKAAALPATAFGAPGFHPSAVTKNGGGRFA